VGGYPGCDGTFLDIEMGGTALSLHYTYVEPLEVEIRIGVFRDSILEPSWSSWLPTAPQSKRCGLARSGSGGSSRAAAAS